MKKEKQLCHIRLPIELSTELKYMAVDRKISLNKMILEILTRKVISHLKSLQQKKRMDNSKKILKNKKKW